MRDDVFGYIWGFNIQMLLNKLLDRISDDTKARYDVKVLNQKNKIKNSYQLYNQFLKKKYHISNGDDRLDQHKIAACLCASIIDNKLIRFSVDNSIQTGDELALINYKLAFAASVSIVFDFLLDSYKNENDFAAFNKLKDNQEIFFPKTNKGHYSYPLCMIYGLALNDIYGVTFDLITYANVMYLLEQYNKKHLA